MGKKLTWMRYSAQNWLRVKLNILMAKLKMKGYIKSFDYDTFMGLEDTQALIADMINKGEPALITRFGFNESRCTAEAIGIQLGCKKHFSTVALRTIHKNAGVFPYGEEMAMRFGQISEEAAGQIDLLGVWSTPMQDYLVRYCCPKDMKKTFLGSLEPYYSQSPWTAALKGKKVLVIHPFKRSIEMQYAKRELLFENPDMLPEFDLTVIQAVQTIASEKDDRFGSWEEALNYMYEEAMKVDFDVAIIGCGAYGMPLAAMLKKSGKIAIHLGGATQILFGIKGSRWENGPIGKLFNEHWIKPSEEETPAAAKTIENGCYW